MKYLCLLKSVHAHHKQLDQGPSRPDGLDHHFIFCIILALYRPFGLLCVAAIQLYVESALVSRK